MIHRPVRQGWQCPACRAVYAPGMPACLRCSNPPRTQTDTNTSPLMREASNGCYCEACMEADAK